MSTLLEEVMEPQIILFGVLGSSRVVTEEKIHEWMRQILEELQEMPNQMILPTEGVSSQYLQGWAEALHVKTRMIRADWQRNGKLAQILQEEYIQKESTHVLVFLSRRTKRLDKMAERLVKKGKNVYVVTPQGELEHIVMEKEPSVADYIKSG